MGVTKSIISLKYSYNYNTIRGKMREIKSQGASLSSCSPRSERREVFFFFTIDAKQHHRCRLTILSFIVSEHSLVTFERVHTIIVANILIRRNTRTLVVFLGPTDNNSKTSERTKERPNDRTKLRHIDDRKKRNADIRIVAGTLHSTRSLRDFPPVVLVDDLLRRP